MSLLSLIRSTFLCFYSGDFYKNLYFKDTKIRFVSLLLVIAAANFITTFAFYSFTKSVIASNYDAITKLQKVEFRNQTLIVNNKNQPLKLYYDHKPFAIIDTIHPPETYFSEKFYIIISKTGLFSLEKHSDSYEHLDFIDYTNENLIWDQSAIKSTIDKLNNSSKLLIFCIAYPIGIIVSLMLIFLKLLFFSLVGFIYGKVSGISFSMSGLIRISTFAVIPSILMQFCLGIYLLVIDANIFEFYGTMNRQLVTNLALVIFIGYFFAALDTVRTTKKHMDH